MLLDKLISIVAPHTCVNCGQEGSVLCGACHDDVAAKRSTCFLCNKITDDFRTCQSCLRDSPLRRVIVASHYEGVSKDLISRLKYQHNVAAAITCADLLVPLVPPHYFDVVVSVPAVSSRLRQRGYNQAELIAKALARRLDLPYVGVLGRFGQSRQVGKPRRQRLEQVSGTIYTHKPYVTAGQRVLLVDDVVTTGATLNECGCVLKQTGTKRVWAAVVAKH